ncbi:MAG: hypothetical protein LRY62_02870, partial [Alphaproteobacteria bacterium]|nr:hypothetical protein [Alphaproteobacteria bacterium]
MRGQQSLAFLVCLASVAIIVLACAGAVINFSPIPFWDMWDGALGFLERFEDKPVNALFAQHNEHRIVLTRLLFLLEYRIMGGNSAFLIFFNYLCVFASCVLYAICLFVLNRETVPRFQIAIASLVLSAWLFLWTQNNNLTWAFQSQFLLAQL